jgi:hypothetical protein
MPPAHNLWVKSVKPPVCILIYRWRGCGIVDRVRIFCCSDASFNDPGPIKCGQVALRRHNWLSCERPADDERCWKDSEGDANHIVGSQVNYSALCGRLVVILWKSPINEWKLTIMLPVFIFLNTLEELISACTFNLQLLVCNLYCVTCIRLEIGRMSQNITIFWIPFSIMGV